MQYQRHMPQLQWRQLFFSLLRTCVHASPYSECVRAVQLRVPLILYIGCMMEPFLREGLY